MRIGIDFRMLSCGRAMVNRGMGRFTQQQLREVLRLGGPHEFVLLLLADHDPALLLPEIAGAANVSRLALPRTLAARRAGDSPRDVLRHAAQLSALVDDLGLDLYHASTPFLAADPSFWRCDSCALVATHYDLIPLVYMDRYFGPESRAERDRYLRSVRALRDADRLLAISEFVRGEAAIRLGIPADRIDVAHPIADPWFRVLPSAEVSSALASLRRRCPLPDEFLLCVTHLHHAKNLHTLLRAFALLPAAWRRRHPLVVVGDLDLGGRQALDGWTLEMGIHDHVVATGFVAEHELAALYNAAHLFVHPSRYEGFGLPVLEAMQCGAPVVAAAAAALPEIVGDAGLLADPEDPASFVRAIERLDGDPGLRRELRAAALARAERFNPRQLGEATLRGYERAAGEASEWRARPASRPRLAVWSPLPPQPSGISDYTVELLDGLRDWADVELFVDDGFLPEPELLDGWPVFHFTAFERRERWRPFDLVVYQMGASMFHLYMLDAVQRWPGLLVLHDMTMSYVRMALFAGGMPTAEVRRELLESDGPAALADYDALTRLDPTVRSRATEEFLGRRLMLRPLVDASLAQVVHLPRAKRELEALYPNARVLAFRMGVEDPWRSAPAAGAAGIAELRRIHGLAPDAFVVGVFGIADPVKRIESTLRALARLADRVPGAMLIVVGRFTQPEYRHGLEQLAGALGVAARVRFLGLVAKRALNQLLLACDAIVNLRHPFRKQMSATLLRAFAAGKPAAVTDVPDWDHFPPSFCYRVRPDETEDANLADWLLGLALDPERAAAASRAAREYYLRHGTLQQLADQYRAVIEELTGRVQSAAAAPAAQPEAPAARPPATTPAPAAPPAPPAASQPPPAAPAAPPAAAAGSRLEEAFSRWDAVRTRSSLTVQASGPLASRALRFLRRAGRRVRDLGVAWDREAEVLRALIDELRNQATRIEQVETEATRLGELQAQVGDLQARLGELLADFQTLLADLPALTARQDTLQARLGGLAVRQQEVEQGLLGDARGLLAVEERLAGASGGGSGTLDASRLPGLLAAIEREVPALARGRAIEVSIHGRCHTEELRQAAAAQFGERLSSQGLTYRYPNDIWLHIDFALGGERPVLLETAAGRLARGGHLLLATTSTAAAIGSHHLLQPAGERDLTAILGAPAKVLIWKKV